ncbi:glutathione peroxidase [Kineococcus radiotolerans]|uniref:Glutathione peroxidase n=1 Tax=Kineococcus radiotolerans (strain ATCC BAA-149 / DSM 14245 / SRS30216) TaxID=266940 RepID=A6W7E6_KINRD|nr:glutathione peroxidase [Kineococcus radiotolerans]ABS02735.1 Glutathione peroxidase [Kineococcus radiotolerans SRS30216 = ATCC BAA-149]
MTSPLDVPLTALTGGPLDPAQLTGRAVLVVNVASRCGSTPQYAGLQELQEEYGERGFTVLGVPCDQFGGQEPGTEEEIAEYCSATWGTTFPMTAKVEVNGPGRHPLYGALTATPDADGTAGDVAWNFEKFLVSPAGEVVARFRTRTTPQDPALRAAIEARLPA